MDENSRADILQITDDENVRLTAMFTCEEVREAIFQMKHKKAPGLDGFPAEFYQTFWEIIKKDLMVMFMDFHNGVLPLYSLNFGIFTLLPKKSEVVQIQQFRPICLHNVSFKVFTKVVVTDYHHMWQAM